MSALLCGDPVRPILPRRPLTGVIKIQIPASRRSLIVPQLQLSILHNWDDGGNWDEGIESAVFRYEVSTAPFITFLMLVPGLE